LEEQPIETGNHFHQDVSYDANRRYRPLESKCYEGLFSLGIVEEPKRQEEIPSFMKAAMVDPPVRRSIDKSRRSEEFEKFMSNPGDEGNVRAKQMAVNTVLASI
jgi:hypothetical protein